MRLLFSHDSNVAWYTKTWKVSLQPAFQHGCYFMKDGILIRFVIHLRLSMYVQCLGLFLAPVIHSRHHLGIMVKKKKITAAKGAILKNGLFLLTADRAKYWILSFFYVLAPYSHINPWQSIEQSNKWKITHLHMLPMSRCGVATLIGFVKLKLSLRFSVNTFSLVLSLWVLMLPLTMNFAMVLFQSAMPSVIILVLSQHFHSLLSVG